MGSALQACCSINPHPVSSKPRIVQQQKLEPPPQLFNSPVLPQITAQQKVKQQEKEQILIEQVEQRITNLNNAGKDTKRFKFQDFRIDGKLGKGGFGKVYLAQLKENVEKGIVEKYAIKRVIKRDIIASNLVECLKVQKDILATFHCKFVTSLTFAFQDERFFYFAMEYACGGDTFSLIKQDSIRARDYNLLGETAVRFIAGCLVLAFQYLHSNGILYRDLKPENVLLFENGYAKLTDFGLSKKVKDDQVNMTQLGTDIYYAPEMVMKTGYNKSLDLWCFGIYLFEMSVHDPPFKSANIKNRQKCKKTVEDAQLNRDWKSSNLSPELKDLINRLLKYNPQTRIGVKSWNQIKEHEFFKGFDWKSLEDMTMSSPLKDIIKKYPFKIEKYIPENDAKLPEAVNVEGWTYTDPAKKKDIKKMQKINDVIIFITIHDIFMTYS